MTYHNLCKFLLSTYDLVERRAKFGRALGQLQFGMLPHRVSSHPTRTHLVAGHHLHCDWQHACYSRSYLVIIGWSVLSR